VPALGKAGRYGVSPLGGVAEKGARREMPCSGCSERRYSAPQEYYFLRITNDFAGTDVTTSTSVGVPEATSMTFE